MTHLSSENPVARIIPFPSHSQDGDHNLFIDEFPEGTLLDHVNLMILRLSVLRSAMISKNPKVEDLALPLEKSLHSLAEEIEIARILF